MPLSFLKEDSADFLRDLIDGGVLAELLDLLVPGDALQANALRDLLRHSDGDCPLLFGEEEHLQHEVIALVGAPAQASLPADSKLMLVQKHFRRQCRPEVGVPDPNQLDRKLPHTFVSAPVRRPTSSPVNQPAPPLVSYRASNRYAWRSLIASTAAAAATVRRPAPTSLNTSLGSVANLCVGRWSPEA